MRKILVAVAVCAGLAHGQRGTGDWMTSAFDAQRSNWVRSDGKISVQSMSKPGFELVWKMKFANTARQLNTITPPALLDFYISYRGFRALGFFGASADKVIGVDIELGRLEWEKTLATGGSAAGTVLCPGGLTSAVTRPTFLAYPPVPTGGGPGRGTPAVSGVGEPYEGAVTLKRVPPPPPPKPVPSAKPAPAAPNPFAARILYVLALTGDGKLHRMWVSNGHEADPPLPFLPARAHAAGLIAVDGVAYAATTNGCPGVDDGVWALDLNTKSVTQWKSKGMAGAAGPAIGPDGTLYAAGGGGQLAALAPTTLQPKSTYRAAGVEFTSSPVVFDWKGRDLIAVATSDGRLHVVDSANLAAGPLARTESFSAPNFAAGSLASWQDPAGTRWLLAPAGGADGKPGAIVAFKVVERGGSLSLEPGWRSRDLVSPAAPVVINGVVFALSTGEYRGGNTVAERAAKSVNAVLYALDGATGKELWTTGNTIASFVHSGTLSAGGSRIYVAAHDGTQYTFSFPMEH
jgi:outer membrane protein assembly factor BamB